ncbi:MAG: hypothetical protein AAF206_12640, partial [Bacteroidota bacterium]
ARRTIVVASSAGSAGMSVGSASPCATPASNLGHKIDWIYYPNLRNPYFIEEIEESKVLLYDQETEEIPV